MGQRKFVCRVWVTWSRWPPCPYMVKTLQKSSSPEPKGHLPCGLICSIGSIIVCSNGDPWLTLTYFMARSNLVSYTFIWGKLLESHLMEETYSKWPEWQKVYHSEKFWLRGVDCPCPGAIYMYKNRKNYVQNQTSKIFFWNLQQMGKVTRLYCWHQDFVHKGFSAPAPGLHTCGKTLKNVYKMRSQRDLFETCIKWSKW